MSSLDRGLYARVMDATLKALLAGTFTQTLSKVEVRQCGVDNPIIYSGPGLIRQDADGEMILQVLDTSKLEEAEKFRRTFDEGPGFGKLIPEKGYFDIEGTDSIGQSWYSKRQSINSRFGQGITEILVKLRRWERAEERESTPRKDGRADGRAWWIPRSFDLPWNELCTIGTARGFFRFTGAADGCSWEATKYPDGVFVRFWADRDLDRLATRFWWGLGVLCGQSLEPRITRTNEGKIFTETLHRPMRVYNQLKGYVPIPLRDVEFGPPAIDFLARYLALQQRPNGKGDPGRLIYGFWHRVLRALHEDIENASLILSVAIEGVIKGVFAPASTPDSAFEADLNRAIAALDGSAGNERAVGVLRGKLEHSAQFPPSRFLHEAKKAGWLTASHVQAWEKMRNKGAHGDLLSDDDLELQNHLDRFHSGLDTFYRLIFQAIGYSGPHLAYGLPNAPIVNFPNEPSTSQSVDTGGAVVSHS